MKRTEANSFQKTIVSSAGGLCCHLAAFRTLFFFSHFFFSCTTSARRLLWSGSAVLHSSASEIRSRHSDINLLLYGAEALKEAHEVLHKNRNACNTDTVNGLAKPITYTMGCAAGLTACGYWSPATLGHTTPSIISIWPIIFRLTGLHRLNSDCRDGFWVHTTTHIKRSNCILFYLLCKVTSGTCTHQLLKLSF